MRMRKKRHGAERIAACSEYFITNQSEYNSFPAELEIGCGKGAFILGCAKRYPDRNFVAMEKISDVILLAAEKLKAENIQNVKLINADASRLQEFFPDGSVSRIYLNFSDPWPKDRHAKRRLTSHEFLARYEKILKKDGTLEFKTDNKDLFDFSLEEMKNAEGWELTAFTYDLHHDVVLSEGNVMTEYEEKFSSIGNPICKMEARFL